MTAFRAIWPITDDGIPLRDLIAAATADLPAIIARAHAKVTGPGRWSMAPSCKVPGSGRVTETVLIYDAPAVAVQRRDYRKAAA